ncbi:MAG: hypothetical protein SGILL_006039 [Bacillariaceae sp.]
MIPGSAGLGTAIASPRSPRTGSAAAPVSLPGSAAATAGRARGSSFAEHSSSPRSLSSVAMRRRRSSSDQYHHTSSLKLPASPFRKQSARSLMDSAAKAQCREAQKFNDALVYLDGPRIYTCGQCRTHLTSHDEIVSKSFHGRHGRAFLFDNCVNVIIGPAEDRALMTGLHSVCDINCKRCNTLVGWTYAKAYEFSQKYKEKKFVIEKINLHLEESDYYDIDPPAGERKDRFRARSISWGSESHRSLSSRSSRQGSDEMIYEYRPSSPADSVTLSQRSDFSK